MAEQALGSLKNLPTNVKRTHGQGRAKLYLRQRRGELRIFIFESEIETEQLCWQDFTV